MGGIYKETKKKCNRAVAIVDILLRSWIRKLVSSLKYSKRPYQSSGIFFDDSRPSVGIKLALTIYTLRYPGNILPFKAHVGYLIESRTSPRSALILYQGRTSSHADSAG